METATSQVMARGMAPAQEQVFYRGDSPEHSSATLAEISRQDAGQNDEVLVREPEREQLKRDLLSTLLGKLEERALSAPGTVKEEEEEIQRLRLRVQQRTGWSGLSRADDRRVMDWQYVLRELKRRGFAEEEETVDVIRCRNANLSEVIADLETIEDKRLGMLEERAEERRRSASKVEPPRDEAVSVNTRVRTEHAASSGQNGSPSVLRSGAEGQPSRPRVDDNPLSDADPIKEGSTGLEGKVPGASLGQAAAMTAFGQKDRYVQGATTPLPKSAKDLLNQSVTQERARPRDSVQTAGMASHDSTASLSEAQPPTLPKDATPQPDMQAQEPVGKGSSSSAGVGSGHGGTSDYGGLNLGMRGLSGPSSMPGASETGSAGQGMLGAGRGPPGGGAPGGMPGVLRGPTPSGFAGGTPGGLDEGGLMRMQMLRAMEGVQSGSGGGLPSGMTGAEMQQLVQQMQGVQGLQGAHGVQGAHGMSGAQGMPGMPGMSQMHAMQAQQMDARELEDKVMNAYNQLKTMGYEDDGGYLKELCVQNQGDVPSIIEFLCDAQPGDSHDGVGGGGPRAEGGVAGADRQEAKTMAMLQQMQAEGDSFQMSEQHRREAIAKVMGSQGDSTNVRMAQLASLLGPRSGDGRSANGGGGGGGGGSPASVPASGSGNPLGSITHGEPFSGAGIGHTLGSTGSSHPFGHPGGAPPHGSTGGGGHMLGGGGGNFPFGRGQSPGGAGRGYMPAGAGGGRILGSAAAAGASTGEESGHVLGRGAEAGLGAGPRSFPSLSQYTGPRPGLPATPGSGQYSVLGLATSTGVSASPTAPHPVRSGGDELTMARQPVPSSPVSQSKEVSSTSARAAPADGGNGTVRGGGATKQDKTSEPEVMYAEGVDVALQGAEEFGKGYSADEADERKEVKEEGAERPSSSTPGQTQANASETTTAQPPVTARDSEAASGATAATTTQPRPSTQRKSDHAGGSAASPQRIPGLSSLMTSSSGSPSSPSLSGSMFASPMPSSSRLSREMSDLAKMASGGQPQVEPFPPSFIQRFNAQGDGASAAGLDGHPAMSLSSRSFSTPDSDRGRPVDSSNPAMSLPARLQTASLSREQETQDAGLTVDDVS